MRRSDIGPLGTVTLILTLLIQVAALSHAESAGHWPRTRRTDRRGGHRQARADLGLPPGRAAARPDGLGALVAGTVRPAIPIAATLGHCWRLRSRRW